LFNNTVGSHFAVSIPGSNAASVAQMSEATSGDCLSAGAPHIAALMRTTCFRPGSLAQQVHCAGNYEMLRRSGACRTGRPEVW